LTKIFFVRQGIGVKAKRAVAQSMYLRLLQWPMGVGPQEYFDIINNQYAYDGNNLNLENFFFVSRCPGSSLLVTK
jgi:hypothetical protein